MYTRQCHALPEPRLLEAASRTYPHLQNQPDLISIESPERSRGTATREVHPLTQLIFSLSWPLYATLHP